MSEVCAICGLDGTHEFPIAHEVACYRLGYERTLARADRYQAEFAACKALLIAEQKRAERAEAERAEAEARSDRHFGWYEHQKERADAAEQKASEARAHGWADAIEAAARKLDGWQKAIAAVGPGRLTVDGMAHSIGIAAAGVRALAALPVEPARPEQREIQRDGDTPSAPSELPSPPCGDGPWCTCAPEAHEKMRQAWRARHRAEALMDAVRNHHDRIGPPTSCFTCWGRGYRPERFDPADRYCHCEWGEERRRLDGVIRAELAQCSDQPALQNEPPSPTGDT